jgi:uncharacterized membrane protein YbhN (UPF0104 family)
MNSRPGKRANPLVRLALSLFVVAFFFWVLRAGALRLTPAEGTLAKVEPWSVLGYVVLWFVSQVVRGGRWYWLLASVEKVPMLTVLRVAFIGFFAIAVMPFRTGEVIRPLLIRRSRRLNAWAATGTVAAERVVDGFAISLILFFALRFSTLVDPLPHSIGDLPISVRLIPTAATVFVTAFACACLAMIVYYVRHSWPRTIARFVLSPISPRLAVWVSSKIEQVAEGLHFLSRPRHAFPFLVGTIVYWFLTAVAWSMLAHGCGLERIGLVEGAAVYGVLALGVLAPNAPGFFGAFQLSIYAGLALYLPREVVLGHGSAYVFLSFLLQIGLPVITGLVLIAHEPKTLKLLWSPPPEGAPDSVPPKTETS